MSIDQASRQRRAQARYDLVRGLAYGLFVAVILASLVLLLLQSREIGRQGDAQVEADKVQRGLSEQIVRQGDQLEALLNNREEDRADRAAEVAEAVKVLTKAQQDQLTRHDTDVAKRLQVLLDEIGRLQQPPRRVMLPKVTASQPASQSRSQAAPRPAPAPAPTPCQMSGNSGRCKK